MKLMQKKIISKHNAIEHWRGCSFSGVGKKSTVVGKIVCSIGILKNHIIILLVQVKIERF